MPPAKKARRAALKEPRPEEQGHDLKLLCAGDAWVLVSSQLLLRSTRSIAIEDIITKLREENPHACNASPAQLCMPGDSAAIWKVVWRLVENPMVEKPEGLTWYNLEEVTALADKYQLVCVLQALEAFIVDNVAHHSVVSEHPTSPQLVVDDDQDPSEDEEEEEEEEDEDDEDEVHDPALLFQQALLDPGQHADMVAEHGSEEDDDEEDSSEVEGVDITAPAAFGYMMIDLEGEGTDFKLELSLLEVLQRAQMQRGLNRLLPAYMKLLRKAARENRGVGRRIRIMAAAVPDGSPVHALVTRHMFKVLSDELR